MTEKSAQNYVDGKLEELRKKLLDLTGRNRLLNFKHPRTGVLRVVDEVPDQLCSELFSDRELKFIPVEQPTEEELLKHGYLERNAEGVVSQVKVLPEAMQWAKVKGFDTGYELPLTDDGAEKHNDNAIQTLLYPEELEARLRGIANRARTAVDETGTNILYLAFGFLRWFEHDQSEESRLSPLYLVPVSLSKSKLDPATQTYSYRLSYSGEDVITNMSLAEKLRIDLGLKLPEIADGQVPSEYFKSVEAMIKSSKKTKWRVDHFCTLSLLNFSKMMMYLDLDPERWPAGEKNITNHEVIKKFFTSSEKEVSSGFEEEYELDDIEEINEEFPLIDDADSSQHSALIDAIKGKNMVIEGPPGTGKSQTITNLIAAALGQGKTVLFVAEKLAALEVVKRRLDKANLGDFCLELHSHKTQKRKILEDLRARMKGNYKDVKTWQDELDRHTELKDTLRKHADIVNREYLETGETVHEILTAATRFRHELDIDPEDVHPSNFDPSLFTKSSLRRVRQVIKSYGEVYIKVLEQLGGSKELNAHPWYGIQNENLQHFDAKTACTLIGDWNEKLKELKVNSEAIAQMIGKDSQAHSDLNDLGGLSEQLSSIPKINGDERLDALVKTDINRCLELEKLFSEYLDLAKERESILETTYESAFAKPEEVNQLLVDLKKLLDTGLTPTLSLISLGKLGLEISQMQEVATNIEPTKEQVVGALPVEVQDFFDGTMNGYKELADFLSLATKLNPALYEGRDEFYELEELDQVLLDLADGISELLPVRNELRYVFDLKKAKALEEIDHIAEIISEHQGLFAWFNKDWRTARKTLLSVAANHYRKFPELAEQLSTLIDYRRKSTALYELHDFEEIMGERFNGLDTDVDRLLQLRTWYRNIRAKYGVGFGPKVVIGDSLIGLRSDLLKGICSLDEQGLLDQIQSLVDDLDAKAEVFNKISSLKTGSARVFGNDGVITELQKLLSRATKVGLSVNKNENDSVDDSIRMLNRLLVCMEGIKSLESNEVIMDVFSVPMLNLSNRSRTKEKSYLSTLALAKSIGVLPSSTADRIRKFSSKSDFDSLRLMAAKLAESTKTEQAQFEKLNKELGLEREAWLSSCGSMIDDVLERNAKAVRNPDWMSHWVNFYRFRNALLKLGFENLTSEIEHGNLPLEDAYSACMSGMYDLLARHIFNNLPEIAHFASSQHASLQKEFQVNDHKLKEIQQRRIAWKCAQKKPPPGVSGGRVKDLTEMGLLTRETQKKTRHIPIRSLVKRSQHALVSLKPCFMMGPMSVAQYLEPGVLEFDLLIMDEASQIRPEDALGAIARSKQVVIVGDPKQLPPTSFFDKLVDGDDDNDASVLQDSESILESVGQLFNQRRLRWHYRSQHESLINFSNLNFYDGDLVLFPSPNIESDEYGVKFHYVSKARFVNRRNIEEAKAVAEAVAKHLKTRKDSLGVVAMSAEQRDQIEKAFEDLQKNDPSLQSALDKNLDSDDPLFFKNLENVQGDERDVILISCTYGPHDHGGPVHQRFGPINSDNGWRRLNVLFTRSKKKMHVFSSMRHTDILPTANSKEGVLALRNFLEYAATGRTSHPTVTGREADSDFEIDVAKQLYKLGYECEYQVGAAGYFIDLAVRDPGNPGRFLMGIECDGATYHSAKSVRDRDRLRQEILENLGWKIRRIWSTDWFANSESQLNPIVRELSELRSEPIISAGSQKVETSDVQEGHPGYLRNDADHNVRDALMRFDREVISPDSPAIEAERKLLSVSMIDALVEFEPTTMSEFRELIPLYLRTKVHSSQVQYIEQVLELIENFEVDREYPDA